MKAINLSASYSFSDSSQASSRSHIREALGALTLLAILLTSPAASAQTAAERKAVEPIASVPSPGQVQDMKPLAAVQTGIPLKVLRYRNMETGAHIYTIKSDAKQLIPEGYTLETRDHIASDSPFFYLYTEQYSNSKPVYRLLDSTGAMAFAADEDERKTFLHRGMVETTGPVYVYKTKVEGSSEIYRVGNLKNNDVVYTTSNQERDYYLKRGWLQMPSLGFTQSSSSSGTGILRAGTIKLEDADTGLVTKSDLHGESITFGATSPNIDAIRPGTILYAEKCAKFPLGLVSKVLTTARFDTGGMEVVTQRASLKEAFDELHIFLDNRHVLFPPNPLNNRVGVLKGAPFLAPGAQASGGLQTASGQGVAPEYLADFSGDPLPYGSSGYVNVYENDIDEYLYGDEDSAASLLFSADTSIGITVEGVVDVCAFDLCKEQATVIITPQESIDPWAITAQGTLQVGSEFDLLDPSWEVWFDVGGPPLSAIFDLYLGYSVSGTITASLSGSEHGQVSADVQYSNGQLSADACPSECLPGFDCGDPPVTGPTCSLSASMTGAVSIAAEAEVWIRPQLGILVGAADTGLKLTGSAKFQLRAELESQDVALYADIVPDLDAELEILGDVIGPDWDSPFPPFTIPLKKFPFEYPLTVTTTGSGTVISTDGNINCGSSCNYAYFIGKSVTLNASPISGWSFSNWGGACTGSNSCTVTMSTAQSVSATFTQNASTYALTVKTTGSGSVASKDSYINCGSSCSHTYSSGTPVTLNASPLTGWSFSGWSGACQGTGSCMVTMSTAKSVTATFTQNASTYALSVAISGSGMVTSTDNYITCSSSCSHTYSSGTPVTLNASPLSGWSFSGWNGVCIGTSSCTLTMSTAQSVSANFTKNASTYALSVATFGSGTVTSTDSYITCGSSCSHTYSSGATVTLNASPLTGWNFSNWSGACTGTGSCTVSMSTAQSVYANFTQTVNYTLNVGLSGTGTVISTDGKINCSGLNGTCSASYTSGTTVVLNGTPGTYYTFGGWSEACNGYGSCSVLMNQNQGVLATFNVSSQPNGQLTVSSPSFAPAFNQGMPPSTIGLLVKNSSGGPMIGSAVASEQSGGAWMTINGSANSSWTAPETLEITFNPAGLLPGVYSGAITLTSQQATNSQVVVPVVLTVFSPLVITTPSALPDAFSGTSYSTTLQASGGSGLTWSVDPNALPSGLTLNGSTGVISGTVGNISGNSALTFVISVTDSYSRLAQQTFTMNWRQGVDIYLWDNSLLQMGVGNPLYQSAGSSFIATGGIAPYTWSATGLPSGVSLSSAGVFSGSPTTLGQSNIVLTATDSTGLSGSLTLTVTTFETLLQIYDSSQNTPPLLKPLVVGTALSASEYFEAAGGTQTGYTWTINGALPPGISAGPNAGCTSTTCALSFTGTPTKAGTYTFVVKVTDSQNNSTTSSQTWVVNSDGNGPTISTTTLPQATIGQAYTQQLAASGGKAPLTWTFLSGHLDSNLSVSSSGSLSGAPGGPNECANGAGLAPRGSVPSTFVVEVTDANGESDVQQLCVTSYFPQPTIQAVTPTIVSDGTAKTITVTGTGFQQLSELFVQYNQQPTVYVSPTELQVTLQPGTGSPFILAGGSQLPPASLQIRVQAPYTMPSNFGSFTIALPPPTVQGVQGSYLNTGAPCTVNWLCGFVISGSGFSYETTYQVSGSSQYIGIWTAPKTLEPWAQVTVTNFIPPQTGSYTVQVTNPNQAAGGSATASGTVQVYNYGTIVANPSSFAPNFTQGDAASTTGLLVQMAGYSSAQGSATVSTQSGGNWLTVGGQLTGSWTSGQTMNVSFNPAGLLPGSYSGSIVLNITNVTGVPGPITVPVTMNVAAPLSILTSSILPSATNGQTYSTTIAETGGSNLIWSLIAGSLPTGLALSPSTGTISGIPAVPGGTTTVSFTIGLQDSLGRFTSRVFSMTVTVVPAALTSPVAGTALSGSTTFSWTAGSGVAYYWFNLGTGSSPANAKNIYSGGSTTATSVTVTGLPTNGETIYATLYSYIAGVWQPTVYTYTASGSPTPAALTTPAPGSALKSTSVTFTWSPGSGVTYYWFNLGTASSPANAKNIYSGSSTTATSVAVTDLPTNGETIYATLYSYIAGAWQPTIYTYTASGSPTPAALTSPAPGSALKSTSVTFTWSPGSGVTHYWFNLGTASSPANAKNIYSGAPTTATSVTVSDLPSSPIGETVYATLYSYIAGAWQPTVYTYTSYGPQTAATLTTPTPGNTLTGSSQTFSWTPGANVNYYWLNLGTAASGAGAKNIDSVGVNGATSVTLTGLPTNGETIYATLYSYIAGAWQGTVYTYTAQ